MVLILQKKNKIYSMLSYYKATLLLACLIQNLSPN